MPRITWLANRAIIQLAGFILLSLVLFKTSHSLASEITIFDVRQTLPMSDDEPVFRDFYINGGTEVGLKEGLVITVTRRKTLYDAYLNRSPGDLHVPVGKVRVIHSQKGLSVARVEAVYSRENLPMLEYTYVMVGDRLDMKTASMPKRKKKTAVKRKKRSESVAKNNYGPIHSPTDRPTDRPTETANLSSRSKQKAQLEITSEPVNGPL